MYEPLYDEYAERLHGYCWSLVGDAAPGAVHDAFVTAARQGGPRGPLRSTDTELWLYGLARTACLQRDTNPRPADNDALARAVAGLRPDQREALYLSASGLLEDHQIARLLGVATDTVGQLIRTGRSRLEHGVLDVLLPGPALHDYETLLMAFETGTLDALFASRIPERPAPELRETVLAACAEEIGHPLGNPRARESVRPFASATHTPTPHPHTPAPHPHTPASHPHTAGAQNTSASDTPGARTAAPKSDQETVILYPVAIQGAAPGPASTGSPGAETAETVEIKGGPTFPLIAGETVPNALRSETADIPETAHSGASDPSGIPGAGAPSTPVAPSALGVSGTPGTPDSPGVSGAPGPTRRQRITRGRGRKVTATATLAASGVLTAGLLTTLITTGAGNGILPSGSRHGMPPGASRPGSHSTGPNRHGANQSSGSLHASPGATGSTAPSDSPAGSGTSAPNPSQSGAPGKPTDPSTTPPGSGVPPTAPASSPPSSPSTSPTPTPTPSASSTPSPKPSP